MVNREGKRFIDELTTRDLASAAILEQTGKTVFLVFDGGIRKRLKTFEGLFHLGLGKEAPTVEALAKVLGVDPATFATTIANYNKYQQSKNDLEFKRSNMALPLDAAALLLDRDLAGRPLHHGRNCHQWTSAGACERRQAHPRPLRRRRSDRRRSWSKPAGRQLHD